MLEADTPRICLSEGDELLVGFSTAIFSMREPATSSLLCVGLMTRVYPIAVTGNTAIEVVYRCMISRQEIDGASPKR